MKPLIVAFLMFMLLGSLVVVNMSSFTLAQTGTQVSGIISQDTTWTKANSPYTLTGPVGIKSGVTLTVEAGATIDINHYYLQVNGTLTAKGTSTDNINIKGSIKFSGSSWNEQTGKGCIIEKANIDSASIEINNASPKINNNTLTNTNALNYIIWIVYGAPIISNNTLIKGGISAGPAGSPKIENNTIINAGLAYTGNDSPIISHNTIILTTASIFDSGITVLGDNHAFISDNQISSFKKGILAAGKPIIQRNILTNNEIGIVANPNSAPLIQNNTVTDNKVGLKIRSSQSIVIYNNIQNSNQNSFVLSETTSSIDATYNYWGTTDTQSINQSIYDFKNDFNLGTVNFTPFLTTPNPQALPNPNAPIPTLTPSATPTLTPTPTHSTMPTQTATPFQSPQSTTTTTITNQPSTQPTSSVANNELILMLVAIIVALVAIVAVLLIKIKKAKT